MRAPIQLCFHPKTSCKGARSRHLQVGARLQNFWEVWERKFVDPWVVAVLRDGYHIPFLHHKIPPLSPIPRELPSYLGSEEKFVALQEEVQQLIAKEAIELVTSQTPGFYNRLFLVPKQDGTWRPVLDVSRLNKYVSKTKFSMETSQTVREAIGRGDWMVSLDMRDAYFHIPIHPQSRRYLRFSFNGQVFQFRAMCFGLSTSPQVFTPSTSSGQQDNTPRRLQDHAISGRLADPGEVSGRNDESDAVYLSTCNRIRNSNKQRQVRFGPDTVYFISRDAAELGDFLGFPEPETVSKSIVNVQRMLALRTHACKIMAEDAGPYGRSGKVCPWCEAPHETLPVLHQKGLVQRVARVGHSDPFSNEPKKRPCLVV